LPTTLVEQTTKHMALVGAAVAEILVVLTEGWVGDYQHGIQINL
jgi:hypothetical protein